MAAVNASCVSFTPQSSSSPMLLSSNFTTFPSSFCSLPLSATVKRRVYLDSLSAINNKSSVCETVESTETQLYSFSPMPLLVLAALPGAATVSSIFDPFVELVKSWNLPDWLIHWGHPGNMAVVLFAMGGYGTYLGFRIRFSDDVEERAKPKLCILNFLEECSSSLLLELLVESRLFSLQINPFLKESSTFYSQKLENALPSRKI